MRQADVVVARTPATAGWGTPPYDPPAAFPEAWSRGGGDNHLYEAARRLLAGLGLDPKRHGQPEWNPLGDLVGPGGRVVLKPNLVRHRHGSDGPLTCVVTDPRLLRAVLDAAVAAVAPGGEVTLADSPLQSCDFTALRQALALEPLMAAAQRQQVRVRLLDYRREEVSKDRQGLIVRRVPLPGDPEGYVPVDLGEHSALRALAGRGDRFRVTQYDASITARHHGDGRHEFLIPRSLLAADLVVSLPKVKTHRKAGITGALKNLVGINGSKAWLPHHRVGSLAEGGDEYQHPSWRKRCITRLWERMDRTPALGARRLLGTLEAALRRSGRLLPFPDPYFEGSWWGNATLPAMVADLNRIFVYAAADGRLCRQPARRILVLADLVIAGEGEGPLEPDLRPAGILLGGTSPVAVDWVAASLMGFAPQRIPTLTQALAAGAWPLLDGDPEALAVLDMGAAGEAGRWLTPPQARAEVACPFRPAAGWRGHIEAAAPAARAG